MKTKWNFNFDGESDWVHIAVKGIESFWGKIWQRFWDLEPITISFWVKPKKGQK